MRKESFVTGSIFLIAIVIGIGLVYGFISFDQKNTTSNDTSNSVAEADQKANDGLIEVPSEVESIQSAVDVAKEGDTIRIAKGSFETTGEKNGVTFGIMIDKSITLEGAGRNATIINGKDKAMFGIYVPDSVSGKVVVRGLAIRGFINNGIEIAASESEVSDVLVTKNGNRGVSYRNASEKTSLHNAIIYANRFNGVYSEKSAVKIYNNTIVENGPTGIAIVVTDTNAKGTSPEIYNNIISGHKSQGIFYDHPAFPKVVVVDHNNLFGNKVAYFEELNNEGTKTRTAKPVPGTGELAVNPNFVDEVDFELPKGSKLATASRDGGELGANGK